MARVDAADSEAPSIKYYFSDHLHSTGLVTDASGNVLSDDDYYPYGENWPIP